jgi:hypothetical protein
MNGQTSYSDQNMSTRHYCNFFIGIVNKKGADHIGCLVHKCFHVSIPRSIEETDEEWPGTSVNIGDQVTFVVEACDFTGSLPYIRGKLMGSRYASLSLCVSYSEPGGLSNRLGDVRFSVFALSLMMCH